MEATPVPGRRFDWERVGPWVAALLLLLLAAGNVGRHGSDLETYWRAARRFSAGSDLYPPDDGLRMFRYAPGVAALFLPLAPLPLFTARAVWYAVLVAASLLAIRLVGRRPGTRAGVALAAACLGVARPFLDEFHYGQVNVIVLLALLAAFLAEDRGRDGVAGLLVSLAIGLKLVPLVFAADLALRRRWRGLAGVAFGLAALAIVPAATYGLAGAVEIHRSWIRSLAAAAPALVHVSGNQSLFGVAARAGLLRPWGALAALAAVAAALLAPGPEPRRSLLLFCLGLAAPLGWMWNYVCALPALHLVASSGRRGAWAVAAFGVLSLTTLYDVGGRAFEHRVFELSLPGLALLAFFVAARLRCSPIPPADAVVTRSRG